ASGSDQCTLIPEEPLIVEVPGRVATGSAAVGVVMMIVRLTHSFTSVLSRATRLACSSGRRRPGASDLHYFRGSGTVRTRLPECPGRCPPRAAEAARGKLIWINEHYFVVRRLRLSIEHVSVRSAPGIQ